ncbi:MAG: hypothetical protein P8Z30_16985 [Acidobacteriota bacterium]
MNRREFIIASAAAGLTRKLAPGPTGNRIDRAALVKRHFPLLTEANINSPLQVPYDSHGREVPYADGWSGPGHSPASPRIQEAVAWLRQDPHRIDLGRVGFILRKADGANAVLKDITNIHQQLDLLDGRLVSSFEFEDLPVRVTTLCHPQRSLLAIRVKSPLIATERLGISIAFPYASGGWQNEEDWNSPDRYRTEITQSQSSAVFGCVLDATRYWVHAGWSGTASWAKAEPHHFHLFAPRQNELDLILSFSPELSVSELPSFEQVRAAAEHYWQEFWHSGGAIDLSSSTDPRAEELERRIILSQYLTAVNCSGSLPPQETGLVTDSWYGKFHLEMHWWHAAHFVLWGRSPLLERSLPWYAGILPRARESARLQGYRGARWPKMVGPGGRESPGAINPFIIWQQPHPIYYAELLYHSRPNRGTLDRYREIVHETAEFMASYAWWDSASRRYILGPPLVPAQESYARIRARVTNPTFELAYWQWALSIAQRWRERLGQKRHPGWDRIIARISRPLVRDGIYAAIDVAPYTLYSDHPSMLYALGLVPPTPLIDPETMRRTFQNVRARWNWDSTWGWDYPAMAMTAARLGEPENAIDVLMMDTPKNRYLPDGQCFQQSNLPLYLPANGGLLYATAMMAAGWHGAPNVDTPGFPRNGRWNVKHRGLLPAL